MDFWKDGTIATPRVFYITDDSQEATAEENEVPQNLLLARPAFRDPGHRADREELNAAQKACGYFGPRPGAGCREQGTRMKRWSIQQLKLRTRCAPMPQKRTLGSRVSRGEPRTTQRRKGFDRRARRSEDNSKRVQLVLGASWSRPRRSRRSGGTSW